MSETYDAALGIHLNVCTGTRWVECFWFECVGCRVALCVKLASGEPYEFAKAFAYAHGWRDHMRDDGDYAWMCPMCVNHTDRNEPPSAPEEEEASGPPPAVAGDSAATPLLSTTPVYYLLPEGATRLWELIDALGMSHRQASAFEYVYRAGRKSGASKADDLRKAVANLEYEIAMLESEGDET